MRTLTLTTAALLLTAWPITASAYAPEGPAHQPVQQAARAPLCHGLEVTVAGTAGPDVLTGTDGRDVIRGFAGRDTIDGGGGNDVICGGRDKDVVNGGAGNDWLGGGHREDTIYGGDGNDVLRGGMRRDRLDGGAGDDTFVVESPQFAGSVDVLDFTRSPAGIRAEVGAGTVTGWGTDTIRQQGLDPVLHYPIVLGSEHDDVLIGGPGTQRLDGNGGDDVLQGN